LRAKLEVGSEGRIVVPPRQAEALGLAGGGDVDFVNARGACALLVPVRGEAPPAPWFAGSLGALTVPEVVQFVFQSLKTGLLLLSFADSDAPLGDAPAALRRKSIYFRDGQVVFASSSDPGDRLGPVLVANGLLSQEDLDRCAALVGAGRPLGQVLVDEGLLTSGELYEGIGEQVKEIFLASFLETSGEFAFIEGTQDPQGQVVKLPDRTRDLILQGMKRVEEAEFRRVEQEVVAETLLAVAEATPPEVEVPMEVELPVLTPPPGAGAPAREKVPAAAGPFETYRRIFRRVHQALSAAEPDATARINTWFDRLPDARRAIFEGVRLTGDGELDVAAVLMNVNVAGTHKGAAARARALEALEELLSFMLFEAKNRLPKVDAEKLLREVGKMQVGKA
jgi:hypothetical protein